MTAAVPARRDLALKHDGAGLAEHVVEGHVAGGAHGALQPRRELRVHARRDGGGVAEEALEQRGEAAEEARGPQPRLQLRQLRRHPNQGNALTRATP